MTHPNGGGFGEVEGWMTVDSDDDPETRLSKGHLERLAEIDHRNRDFTVAPLRPRQDDDSQPWDLSHRQRETVGAITRKVRLGLVVAGIGVLVFFGVKAVVAFQEAVGL